MRVLHVNNTAGNPQTIAKLQRSMNIDADVIYLERKQLKDDISRYGFKEAFPAIVCQGSPKKFLLKTLRIARKYDIIHVHAIIRAAIRIKQVYRKKPVILTLRGVDIRGKWDQLATELERFDLLTVSTKDLLEGAPDGVVYTPNTVDLEIFTRVNEAIPGTALYTQYTTHIGKQFLGSQELGLKIAKDEAKKRNLVLRIHKIDDFLFKFTTYPRFLELFEYYIQAKEVGEGIITPVLTSTSLQCLALGNKLIHQGKVHENLPKEHDPETVKQLWFNIYNDLIK